MDKLNKKQFDKNFNLKYLTYTKWVKGAPHPITFNEKNVKKNELCSSGALFARKFTSDSAKKFGLSCKINKNIISVRSSKNHGRRTVRKSRKSRK